MASLTCATGRVVPLPPGARPDSGATHALVDDAGQVLFVLRSRTLTLDVLAGKVSRVCGRRRGHVLGEPAPVLEVEEAIDLDRLPLCPGLDRKAGGARLESPALPVRPLISP